MYTRVSVARNWPSSTLWAYSSDQPSQHTVDTVRILLPHATIQTPLPTMGKPSKILTLNTQSLEERVVGHILVQAIGRMGDLMNDRS